MGEAKRKSNAKVALQNFLDSLENHCVGQVDAEDHAHCLVLELGHIQAARTALGVLPALVEDSINQANQMRDSNGQSQVFAVAWTHWPSGRQDVAMLAAEKGLPDLVAIKQLMDAGARGYGIKLCAFPEQGWRDAFSAEYKKERSTMAEIRQMVSCHSELQTVSFGRETFILVPLLRDRETQASMTALILRKLDELVATEEVLLKNLGAIAFNFEGLDANPSEVWDIDECAQLLRQIDTHAPFWPLLFQAEQFLMFIGALLAQGKTVVNTSGEVSFPIDTDVVEALKKYWIQSSMAACHAAGIDIDRQDIMGRFLAIESIVQQFTVLLTERTKALAAGEKTVAPQDDPIRFGHGGPRIRRAVIIDRSTRGLDLLKQMLGGIAPFPSTRTELGAWLDSKAQIAVVTFSTHEPSLPWVVNAHADDLPSLRKMVEELANRAITEKASFSWTLGVEDSLQTRLDDLGKTIFPEVAAQSGLEVFEPEKEEASADTNAWHKGLLNLATEPIGREVDFDSIQITDATEFAKVTNLGMGALMSVMQEINQGKRPLDDLDSVSDEKLRAWEREDGTLLVREMSRTPREAVIAAGKWRELNKAELAAAHQELQESWATNPNFPADLSRIADSLNQSLDVRARNVEAAEQIFDKVTSVVGIFSRESQSLLILKTVLGNNASAIDTAERWLNSSDEFFVYCRAKRGEACGFFVENERMLMEEVLPSALEFSDSPDTTLLSASTQSAIDQRAEQWWAANGGLVRPTIVRGH